MKLATLGIAAIVGLSTTGCSTLEPSTTVELDQERIFYINKAAKYSSTNVDVIWVNPPKKRVKKKQ